MTRAPRLLARLYGLARVEGHLPTEAFLEQALAAALEEREVWPRLRVLAGWQTLPETTPDRIDSQLVVEEGRTDLTLRWERGVALVLELKAWSPPAPTLEQMLRYQRSSLHVAAICTDAAIYPQPILPTLTWTRIRQHRWDDAPLVWRQLCHLLDETGVAVPLLDAQAMVSIPVFTRARSTVARYASQAGAAMARILSDGGPPWKSDANLHDGHQRLAVWVWPGQWDTKERLGIACGLYVGREGDPLLVRGVPDLLFMLHANPKMPRPQRLRADPRGAEVMDRWRALPGSTRRWANPQDWELMRARESLAFLLTAPEQEGAFVNWMEQRAREFVETGGRDWILEVGGGEIAEGSADQVEVSG